MFSLWHLIYHIDINDTTGVVIGLIMGFAIHAILFVSWYVISLFRTKTTIFLFFPAGMFAWAVSFLLMGSMRHWTSTLFLIPSFLWPVYLYYMFAVSNGFWIMNIAKSDAVKTLQSSRESKDSDSEDGGSPKDDMMWSNGYEDSADCSLVDPQWRERYLSYEDEDEPRREPFDTRYFRQNVHKRQHRANSLAILAQENRYKMKKYGRNKARVMDSDEEREYEEFREKRRSAPRDAIIRSNEREDETKPLVVDRETLQKWERESIRCDCDVQCVLKWSTDKGFAYYVCRRNACRYYRRFRDVIQEYVPEDSVMFAHG